LWKRRGLNILAEDKILKIGGLSLRGRVVLAPMSGVTNSIFRRIAKRYGGAALVFTEVISAEGLIRGNPYTLSMLRFREEERPIGIQLLGSDPQIMAWAAQIASRFKPDLIDLNFGCPARKVIRKGAGAFLLKDFNLSRRIIEAVVEATPIPVTLKMRVGWNRETIVASQLAEIAEDCQVKGLIIHGRTATQRFSGEVNLEIIESVKEKVSIPVIGNGDVSSPEKARKMILTTGCDGVMIGRGALGNPWILSQVHAHLRGEEPPQPMGLKERIGLCLEHYRIALEETGEFRAVREMRKQIAWYTKGLPQGSILRKEIYEMKRPAEVIKRLSLYQRLTIAGGIYGFG
jgi:tRNA-dihydrouridine synthase B